MFDIRRFENYNEMHRRHEDNGRNFWPFHPSHEGNESITSNSQCNIINRLDNYKKPDDHQSFHRAIKPILSAAEILGVPSMRGPSTKIKSGFVKLSCRTWYTVMILILLIIKIILDMYRAIEETMISSDSLSPGTIVGIIRKSTFYLNCFISVIIFLWISTKWGDLMKEWKTMKNKLNSAKKYHPQYRKKLYTISCFVMIPAVAEHVLSLYNYSRDPKSLHGFLGEYYDAFNLRTVPTTLEIFLGGMVLFFVREITTFIWSFTDLFIMLISTGLAEQYKSLNKSALNSIRKNQYSIDWLELRKKYATLSILVKKTDELISPLILSSFASNIYVICLQLYNGVSTTKSGALSLIYFSISFAFVVGRTIAVILSAARINDRSKSLLPEIYCCPASYFTIETERLRSQLTFDDVALTGMKLFTIDRQLIMSILSIIITYEVILLQTS